MPGNRDYGAIQSAKRLTTGFNQIMGDQGPATFSMRGLTFQNPAHLIKKKNLAELARERLNTPYGGGMGGGGSPGFSR